MSGEATSSECYIGAAIRHLRASYGEGWLRIFVIGLATPLRAD